MAESAIPVVPCGAFFPKSTDGFILNPCSGALIDERYRAIIEKIKASYIQEEGSNLHSIYLRGSVARGMVIGPSDVDTFALVFSENDRWRRPEWAVEFQHKLLIEVPFISAAEIYLSGFAPVMRSLPDSKIPPGNKSNPQLAMVIQSQSLCIYGEDVSQVIPPYRPGVQMALNSPWLQEDMNDYLSNRNDRAAKQQFLKTLLRSGFELVMPQMEQYTPDLYLCYSSFSHYYPEHREMMKKALWAYLNPDLITDKEMDKIAAFLGRWLIKRIEEVLVER